MIPFLPKECGACSSLCYSCTGMCIGVCSVKCENGCSSCSKLCGWWCDSSCNRDCFSNCDNRCINTCSGSCATHLMSETINTNGLPIPHTDLHPIATQFLSHPCWQDDVHPPLVPHPIQPLWYALPSHACYGGCVDNNKHKGSTFKTGKGRGCSSGCTLNCILHTHYHMSGNTYLCKQHYMHLLYHHIPV